ncbi:MAG: GDP-L-fucose synthase [bacterium]|nr:GDP-L-fucose synthase [bacterium]
MERSARIYVAGHRGLAGSAIIRSLEARNYSNVITRTRAELDLIDQEKVEEFFAKERPEYVFMTAARVGSMTANLRYPGSFIFENLAIQNNIINFARRFGVKRLIFFGSNCAYPRECPQPIKEEYLLTGVPEPTNESYAIAKIAGIELCRSFNKEFGTQFVSLIPASLYGPNDHFGSDRSHIIPMLIETIHQAKLYGEPFTTIQSNSGKIREFLYTDDLADAVLTIAAMPWEKCLVGDRGHTYNVGNQAPVSMSVLAQTVCDVIGYRGDLRWNDALPRGMPQKVLSAEKMSLMGWNAPTSLENGIELTYRWYLNR